MKVNKRARAMRLRVDPRSGAVMLTVPRRVSQRRALEWAAGQRAWVEKALAGLPKPIAIGPGASLPFCGAPHVVDWRPDRPRRIERRDGLIVAGGPEEGLEARILRWLKRQALEMLDRETRAFATAAGRDVARVAVGDPGSRWGSCSASGSIRYSWRLILAPDAVRRATVAHEVAHLVHMDHGPAFHALVRDLLGADPRRARLWLRREGAALHRIGGRR